jgi:hypothetical protein
MCKATGKAAVPERGDLGLPSHSEQLWRSNQVTWLGIAEGFRLHYELSDESTAFVNIAKLVFITLSLLEHRQTNVSTVQRFLAPARPIKPFALD